MATTSVKRSDSAVPAMHGYQAANAAAVDAGMFLPDPESIAALGACARALRYVPAPYNFLPWITHDRARRVTNFCLFMVAIDHNTHSKTIQYEAVLDGQLVHGSDLLFVLAQKAVSTKAELFEPAYMSAIGDDEVADIFRAGQGIVPEDVSGRAEIFRDVGRSSLALWGGDFLSLVSSLHYADGENGLIPHLARIDAFSDPVGKKANLLCKTLIREGLFQPEDRAGLDIPIDHVVMTMALRSGIVRCGEAGIVAALVAGLTLNETVVTQLRHATRAATRQAAAAAGVMPDALDDLLWSYGRKSLRQPTPLPAGSEVHSELDALVKIEELPAFIARMNGTYDGAPSELARIKTTQVPFTRFF